MNYLVTWQINIDAPDPEQAARLALEIMQDKESIATVFTVKSEDDEVLVDLNYAGELS